MIELLQPIENQTADQMQEVGFFLSERNVPIQSPVVFLNAWLIGKTKIFLERENQQIIELAIVSLFECPITGKIYPIPNYVSSVEFGKKVKDLCEMQLDFYL